jgi:Na+-driven multidrug efflux pump
MGAKLYPRVQQILRQAIGFVVIYVGLVCLLLLALKPNILSLFSAVGDEAELIAFFLNYISFGFIFMASMFVANASFNNMGKPTWATVLNFTRALGAVPFLFAGAYVMGAKGVFLGQMLWTVCVAVVGVFLSFNLLGKIAMGDEAFSGVRRRHNFWRVPVYSFSSFKVMSVEEGEAMPVAMGDDDIEL